MKVTLGNTLYSVSWNHSIPNRVKDNVEVGKTRCTISMFKENQWIPLFFGKSKKSINDNFNKDKGRKISLKRSLNNKQFTKDDRKLFWEAYLNRNN